MNCNLVLNTTTNGLFVYCVLEIIGNEFRSAHFDKIILIILKFCLIQKDPRDKGEGGGGWLGKFCPLTGNLRQVSPAISVLNKGCHKCIKPYGFVYNSA